FSVTLQTAGAQTATATDTHASTIKGQTTVNVLPVASLSGPATGTVGQALTFTLGASGGASASTAFTLPLDRHRARITHQTTSRSAARAAPRSRTASPPRECPPSSCPSASTG